MKTHHLVATSNEDGNSSRVGTLLDDEHLVAGRAKGDFTDDTGGTELVGGKVLKPGDNAAFGGDGDEL
jgi:hypothetical protein